MRMRNNQTTLSFWAIASLSIALVTQDAQADPVWHCSRSDVQIADTSNDFTLAALTLEREVIRIALRDLYNVYQGNTVRMNGGQPLSACVFSEESSLTASALQSIGARPSTLKALAKQTSLAKSNIHMVEDEATMLSCISKNHPAIGYFPKVIQTEAVGPCF